MAITKTKFGSMGTKEVYSITLTNKNGTVAEILNYGGIIRKLVYNGVDVVLAEIHSRNIKIMKDILRHLSEEIPIE